MINKDQYSVSLLFAPEMGQINLIRPTKIIWLGLKTHSENLSCQPLPSVG